MKALKAAVSNKYFLYTFIVALILGMFQINSCNKKSSDAVLDDYKRQLAGQLSDQERELQSAHLSLGVARSELVTQQELSDLLSADHEELDQEFSAFRRRHALNIKSRDRTIARLRQLVNGGSTSVVISTDPNCAHISTQCTIAYNWADPLGRFQLKDPNIFKPDNEIFSSSQLFKIYGEVYQQIDGSLQTRRLVLREVTLQPDGSYAPIPGGRADIIDSQFDYTNAPHIIDSDWTDMFRLRALAIGSIQALPAPGAIMLGAGVELFSYGGLGINTYTAFNFTDMKDWSHRLGLSYRPTVAGSELNLAFGAGLGTPYYKFGKSASLNLDIIFYLND